MLENENSEDEYAFEEHLLSYYNVGLDQMFREHCYLIYDEWTELCEEYYS